MSQPRSPTVRLLAGLAITLSAVALYSGYMVMQLRGLERLQVGIIDRNRADSLLLIYALRRGFRPGNTRRPSILFEKTSD